MRLSHKRCAAFSAGRFSASHSESFLPCFFEQTALPWQVHSPLLQTRNCDKVNKNRETGNWEVFCREERYENIIFRTGNEDRKYTVPSAHADPQQGNYYDRISLLDCLSGLLYQTYILQNNKGSL
jgi:hypothetical protein